MAARALSFTLLLVISLSLTAGAADAARRMALVIGIDDYQSLPKLRKAVGDAEAMRAKLAELGFEVTPVINPGRQQLNIEIGKFTSRLSRDDIVFVHFSGHGVEIDGENILLPADVPTPASGQASTVKYEGVGLRRLIGDITRSGARTRIVVVDACRDNPFEQVGVRSVGSARGLSRMEAPVGTFIMYSAGYRQTALDHLGEDDDAPTSVYTRVLLRELSQPGKSISRIARDVRNRVEKLAKDVGHKQRPAYYDELSSGLVLKTKPKAPVPTSTAPTPVKDGAALLAVDLAYWEAIKSSRNVEAVRSYLEKFPQGQFVALARIRLSELERASDTKVSPPAKPQKLAALPDQPAGPDADGSPSTPDDGGLSGPALARAIQGELDRLGCRPGGVDGAWGGRSRAALRRFAKHRSINLASLTPSSEILKTLQQEDAPACPPQQVKRRKQVTCRAGQRLSRGKCVAKRKKVKTKKKKTASRKRRRKPSAKPRRGRKMDPLADNRNRIGEEAK